MIGAVVFVIFFLLFLVITIVVPTLPPGDLIQNALGIPSTTYPILGIEAWILINAIINGVIYGILIWLIYSIVNKLFFTSNQKTTVSVEIKPSPPQRDETKIAEVNKKPANITKLSKGVPILQIEGTRATYKDKLAKEGIQTSGDLLEAGATRKGRKDLAEKTSISPKLIMTWVNLADLIRIKGVSEEYSDLLEEAGVDTVVELSLRNPEKLHEKLVEINNEKKLVRRLPSLTNVSDWITQARQLPRIVKY